VVLFETELWSKKDFAILIVDFKRSSATLSGYSIGHGVDDLIIAIQQDPELWEIVEKLKSPDEDLEDFLLSIAHMLSIEFQELHKTDLSDKLASLFGGLPSKSLIMAPMLLHIALDIFLMRAIPHQEEG
jgi:hypothetical protein